jgi:hypothetical protein
MLCFRLEETEDDDVKQKRKKVMIEVKSVVKGAGVGYNRAKLANRGLHSDLLLV